LKNQVYYWGQKSKHIIPEVLESEGKNFKKSAPVSSEKCIKSLQNSNYQSDIRTNHSNHPVSESIPKRLQKRNERLKSSHYHLPCLFKKRGDLLYSSHNRGKNHFQGFPKLLKVDYSLVNERLYSKKVCLVGYIKESKSSNNQSYRSRNCYPKSRKSRNKQSDSSRYCWQYQSYSGKNGYKTRQGSNHKYYRRH
jgi:hypothetical protein